MAESHWNLWLSNISSLYSAVKQTHHDVSRLGRPRALQEVFVRYQSVVPYRKARPLFWPHSFGAGHSCLRLRIVFSATPHLPSNMANW